MKGLAVFSFLICFFSQNTYSQESWSLQACIAQAVKNSLTIEEIELSKLSSDLDHQSALAARHPSLNGSASVNLNFGRTIDPTSNEFITKSFLANNYGLNSGVILYNGGRLKNNIKQAKVNQLASKEDQLQAERDLSIQVAGFFLNVVFAEENLELAKNQLKQSQAQLDQIDKFIKAGARPANDRLELEAQYAQNEQNIIVVQNTFDINMLQLKQLLRIDIKEKINLVRPEEVAFSTDPSLVSFEEVYNMALKSYPAIVAAEHRFRASEISIDLAESALLPTINAGANIGTNYSNQGKTVDGFNFVREEQDVFVNGQAVTLGIDSPDPILSNTPFTTQFGENISYGAGLGVNVPIYNNKTAKIGVEKAKLSVASSRIGIERIKENLKILVQQSIIDARGAKLKLESTLKRKAVQKAAYDNAAKRYEVGAASAFEWTNQKDLFENIQINELIDKYDYLFKIKLLEFYMGKSIQF